MASTQSKGRDVRQHIRPTSACIKQMQHAMKLLSATKWHLHMQRPTRPKLGGLEEKNPRQSLNAYLLSAA